MLPPGDLEVTWLADDKALDAKDEPPVAETKPEKDPPEKDKPKKEKEKRAKAPEPTKLEEKKKEAELELKPMPPEPPKPPPPPIDHRMQMVDQDHFPDEQDNPD